MKPLILQPRRIGLAIRLRDRSNDNPNMLKTPLLSGRPFKKPFNP